MFESICTDSIVVEVGDNPDAGVRLITTILGNRKVRQILMSLDVRLDEETVKSLAYICTLVKPEMHRAQRLQFFSYVPPIPEI